MDTDFLQDMRSDRARQRKKKPCRTDMLTRVCCIVKEYGLTEEFLELAGRAEGLPFGKGSGLDEMKTRSAPELPPFCLVSAEDFRLSQAIADRLSNPYLQFAHSPEEMLLSVPLYEADPSIHSEDLLRYDFESLLLYRCAR